MLYLTEAMEWLFGRTQYTTLTQETAIPIVSTNSQHWKTFTATKVIFFFSNFNKMFLSSLKKDGSKCLNENLVSFFYEFFF